MALLVLMFSLVSCFLLLSSSAQQTAVSVRESAVNACLMIGVIIATLTEALSAIGRIERASVITAWLLIANICAVVLFLRRSTIRELALSRLADRIQLIRRESVRASHLVVVALMLILITGIFVVSLTITNNYDSY